MTSASRPAPADPEAEAQADGHVDQDAGAAGHEQGAGVADERVLIELEAEVEQQEDQAERGDQLDVGGLERQREEVGIRARQHADDHVDRDRGQADQLAEASQDIGEDEQDPENQEILAQVVHDQLPGGALTESAGAFALNSPVR